MIVKRIDDPGAFLAAAEPLLLEDEARHNLMLGIGGTLRDHPSIYREYGLWLVEDGDRVVGAALQTPPLNLVVALPEEEEVATALADALHAEGVELPGLTGAVPEVDTFAQAWEHRSGMRRRRRMAQRIYKLTTLRSPEAVSGAPRLATDGDRPLLLSWIDAFSEEGWHDAPPPAGNIGHIVDSRLRVGAGGFILWENPEPVSLAGWGGLTPHGVRIGPVYTPPEHRRCGYGSAVMGGYVTMALCRRHPDRLLGVVLADTKADADTAEARGNRERVATAALDGGFPALVGEMLPTMVGQTTLHDRALVLGRVRGLIQSAPPQAVAWAQRAMADRPDSFDTLRGLQVPALVIVGGEDRLSPPSDAEAMADAVPDGRLVVIGEAGHLSAIERPEAFNRAVAAFTAELAGAAPPRG